MKPDYSHNSWVGVSESELQEWRWCGFPLASPQKPSFKKGILLQHIWFNLKEKFKALPGGNNIFYNNFFFYLCALQCCAMSFKRTRLVTWMMLETLPWGGDSCLVVRMGSSMVTETPEFCWLIERRTTLSLGVTERRGERSEICQNLNKTTKVIHIRGLPFFASPSVLTDIWGSEASSQTLSFLLSLEVLRCFSCSVVSTSSSSFVCPFSWLSLGMTWQKNTKRRRSLNCLN